MKKFILQMGDDEHSTQTMYENSIAITNTEHQLNKPINIVQINDKTLPEIVNQLCSMIRDSGKTEQYIRKEGKLSDDNIIKCIIKDVGPHGTDQAPYKIYLAAKGNFEVEEIAHIEEFNDTGLIMNRIFAITPEDEAKRIKLTEVKFWNANFDLKCFDVSENLVHTYTEK